ncbi:MAG: OmpH family outer membrane protein [Sterolibacterium sp.]|nr:OmpH family outer membrane protein [Sterolibacterium sp.]MBP9799003.1 OmpH family outer membrane protein [Sterolibacterium sp.]
MTRFSVCNSRWVPCSERVYRRIFRRSKVKIVFVAALAAVSLMTAGAVQAEVKIGYINTQRVLSDAPQAARAKKKIEKEFEKRNLELQKIAKQLQSLQESMEKNAVTLHEAERRNKEREFTDLGRDFQRREREFKEDLNLRQNEEMAAIFERVNKAIKAIGETEKFDLIVQEALYASPRIDITDRVLKQLGDGGGK